MMSYLKLRELWTECEKLDESVFNVFVEGLSEIHNKKFVSKQHEKWVGEQPMKPCVAEPTIREREKWTEAEEDLLHKCCQNTSVVKGVRIFREKTGYKRTQGACELRANEMKRKGRW